MHRVYITRRYFSVVVVAAVAVVCLCLALPTCSAHLEFAIFAHFNHACLAWSYLALYVFTFAYAKDLRALIKRCRRVCGVIATARATSAASVAVNRQREQWSKWLIHLDAIWFVTQANKNVSFDWQCQAKFEMLSVDYFIRPAPRLESCSWKAIWFNYAFACNWNISPPATAAHPLINLSVYWSIGQHYSPAAGRRRRRSRRRSAAAAAAFQSVGGR